MNNYDDLECCDECGYSEDSCKCHWEDPDVCPDCEHTEDKCICYLMYDTPPDCDE